MLFSIVCPFWQPSVIHDRFINFLSSLQDQLFQDFELLIVVDSTKDSDIEMYISECIKPYTFSYRIIWSDKHYGDWGHTQRDIGIREAQGEYILHTNPDNWYDRRALTILADQVYKAPEADFFTFGIKLMGATSVFFSDMATFAYMEKPRDYSKFVILIPRKPMKYRIDVMQLVGTKDMWLKAGGWYDKSETSDGAIYEKLGVTFKYKNIDLLLGEHY